MWTCLEGNYKTLCSIINVFSCFQRFDDRFSYMQAIRSLFSRFNIQHKGKKSSCTTRPASKTTAPDPCFTLLLTPRSCFSIKRASCRGVASPYAFGTPSQVVSQNLDRRSDILIKLEQFHLCREHPSVSDTKLGRKDKEATAHKIFAFLKPDSWVIALIVVPFRSSRLSRTS